MSLRIDLDRDRCIGSENCVAIAPKTFETQGGQVVLLPPPHDDEQTVSEAVASCPVAALRLAIKDRG